MEAEIGRQAVAPLASVGTRLRRWSVPVVLLLAVVGVGLALQPGTAQGAPPAPDFTLPFASGGHGALALHTLRGHPVLLNFFNTQCPPCLDEMPVLQRAARTYGPHGVVVLGVATGGDTVATARQFAAADHLPYRVVADEHQAVAWRYNVAGWPTTFFLDAQGRLRGQVAGPLDARAIRNGLAQAGAVRCATCSRIDRASLQSSAQTSNELEADDVWQPAPAAARFALRDQHGALITPATFRGKVIALTFISAVCKEQCPLVGQSLGEAWRRMGKDRSRLAIVAISVDPEQDSPKAIQQFAHDAGWQGTDWHYLTAPRAVLKRVWASYYVDVEAPSPIFKSGQSIVHDAGVYFIDPHGKLRAYDHAPFLGPRVAASVRALLSS